MKYRGSTPGLHLKLYILSVGEESGIPSVAVKCVDTVSYTHLDVYKRQAIGCAILAKEYIEENNITTPMFRGFEQLELEFKPTSFECNGCLLYTSRDCRRV